MWVFPCLWVQPNCPFLPLYPVICCRCFSLVTVHLLEKLKQILYLISPVHMVNSSTSYVGWVVDEEHQEEKKQFNPAQALTAGITAMYSKCWLQYCWKDITFTVSNHVKLFPVKTTMFFVFRVKPPDLCFR